MSLNHTNHKKKKKINPCNMWYLHNLAWEKNKINDRQMYRGYQNQTSCDSSDSMKNTACTSVRQGKMKG